MKITVNKEPKNTYKIEVIVPKEKVAEYLEEALHHEAENVEVKGFRKGKAPINLVKEQLGIDKLRSHALNHLLPEIYKQIINENKINPIINPRFDLKKFVENEDLELMVVLVERPEIKINDYISGLKKKYSEKKEDLTNEEVVEVILNNSTVDVSNVLIEEETDRMMSSLLEQTEKMGITLDKYLEAVKKSPEEVRAEYIEIAEKSLRGDFALTEIAIKEGYTVSDEEIEETIKAVPDDNSREELRKPEQKYYIKAVLTKGKTLAKLAEIAKNIENNSKKEEK